MKNLAKIRAELAKRREILFAYLFGSQAKGRTWGQSDVDIAVWVDEKRLARLEKKAPYGYLAELTADLSLAARQEVDVVLLNSASPVLAHEVVRHGFLLLERRPPDRVDFEVRSLRDYVDTKPLRDIFWSRLEKRLRSQKTAHAH